MRTASVLIAALTIPLVGCSNLGNLHGRPTIERKVRPVAPDRPLATEAVDPDTIVSPGIVEPWDAQVDLSAQEAGWIASILVKEGDTVEKGHVLATLDDATQRHAIEQAKADLAEAEAVVARMEHGTTLEELQQAQAEYDGAVAREEFARATAVRHARRRRD